MAPSDLPFAPDADEDVPNTNGHGESLNGHSPPPWPAINQNRATAMARSFPDLRLARPRVLLTTEGTYPYAMGGVSTWSHLLVNSLTEFDWQILPIVAPDGRPRMFELPPHAEEVGRIEVWSEELPKGGRPRAFERRAGEELPAILVKNLLGWDGDTDAVVAAWVWCRRFPPACAASSAPGAGGPRSWAPCARSLPSACPRPGRRPRWTWSRPRRSTRRCTGSRAPRPCRRRTTDVLHVTAAGWSAIPAVVHKALHGTPMVLTEHGVYVREAYLAAARNGGSPGSRFATTRIARGLARVAYAGADVVAPVTDANAYWEMGLGIDPASILVLYNGVRQPSAPELAPRAKTVVSIGRIDPLKDVHTLLRVAAETVAFEPEARFRTTGR